MSELKKTKIKEGIYEGYLWFSDQPSPQVYECPECLSELELDDASNPFIVEGQLYDCSQGLSYSIRYGDGHYLVSSCTLVEREAAHACREEFYLTKRMGGKVICLQELWQEEEDEYCAGMKVLQLKRIVFKGFKK